MSNYEKALQYLNGNSVVENNEEALRLFKKALIEEETNIIDIEKFVVGCLEKGIFLEYIKEVCEQFEDEVSIVLLETMVELYVLENSNDLTNPIRFAKKLIDLKQNSGKFFLAILYLATEDNTNKDIAIKYLEELVEDNYENAYYHLASIYNEGILLEKNNDKALELCNKVNSHETNCLKGIILLENNDLKGEELIKSEINNGYNNGNLILAECYIKGIGVSINLPTAKEYLNAGKDCNTEVYNSCMNDYENALSSHKTVLDWIMLIFIYIVRLGVIGGLIYEVVTFENPGFWTILGMIILIVISFAIGVGVISNTLISEKPEVNDCIALIIYIVLSSLLFLNINVFFEFIFKAIVSFGMFHSIYIAFRKSKSVKYKFIHCIFICIFFTLILMHNNS